MSDNQNGKQALFWFYGLYLQSYFQFPILKDEYRLLKPGFWIISRCLIGSPARKALQLSSLEMTRTRSCAACSIRKGLIFLLLCNGNLDDHVIAMWSAGHQRQ